MWLAVVLIRALLRVIAVVGIRGTRAKTAMLKVAGVGYQPAMKNIGEELRVSGKVVLDSGFA